ncbi:hypothetical protein B9Z55_027544 [Caenorhabditis nigoni]|uniref:Uncharacterized protein n=1 Tax=Caenorhabditis nigoni TaxID=1611254 RepID=A0A2G5SFI0_9PELO|nr:hypothetical protein B9Z55_027544 [Caenorhabditis nigoni]
MRNEEGNEAPEQSPEDSDESTVNDESDIQNQVAEATEQKNNHAQNLVQTTQKRVKIENFLEDMQQEPEVIVLDEKPEISQHTDNGDLSPLP